MTKANIYDRFSPRSDADESLSNEKQEARNREYCAQKGYEVERVFEDEALTGLDDEQDPDPAKAVVKRSGLLNAIEATTRGMVLVVRWRSRIARDPYIQAWVRRTLQKKGARLEAADEPNVPGLAGELLDNTLATIDKYRAIELLIVTALAMQKYQRNGRRMSRADRTPYGWKADGKLLVKDSYEQDVIRKIKELRDEGLGHHATCTVLDRLGIHKRGKPWKGAACAIRRILARLDKDVNA